MNPAITNFLEGLKTLRPFLEKDESRTARPVLEQTLYFNEYQNKLYLTYTDGFRLFSLYVTDTLGDVSKNKRHMIHVDTIDRILEFVKKHKKDVWSFNITPETMIFVLLTSDRKTVQLEETFQFHTIGTYPDITRVIPTESPITLFVDGKKFHESLHKISDIMYLSWDGKEFHLRQTMTNEIDGQNHFYVIQPENDSEYKKVIQSIFTVQEAPPPFEVAYNAKFMRDMINIIGKRYTRIKLYPEAFRAYKKEETMYKIMAQSGDGSFALVMPLSTR